MEQLLVFDSISSGTRACLYTADGKLLQETKRPLAVETDGCLRARQDASAWWEALAACARELLRDADPTRIAAVSFTAQCMCCLCVDRGGRPLYPALIWSDRRAAELAPSQTVDPAEQYQICGTADHAGSSIQKLRWFLEREPEIYRKTYKMLQCKDYLAYRMTGRLCTDYSDASCSCAFDIRRRKWSRKLLESLGVAPEKLPEAFPSATVIGGVTQQAAAQTGLRQGTPVVIGAQDFVCSAIGAGCVRSGDVYLSLGSSSWIAACTGQPIMDERRTLANQVFPPADSYLAMANLQNIGTVFKWLRNGILHYASPTCTQVEPYRNLYPYTGLGAQLRSAPPGANGLLFIPYLLENESVPENRAAAYLGMSWRHTRADLVRAAAEGVAFDLKTYLERIVLHTGRLPRAITVVGTGAGESEWLQLLADVLAVPIHTTSLSGTSDSVGAAMIAGNAIGLFGDYDAQDLFWKTERQFQPDLGRSACYQRLYPLFLDACRQLVPLHARLASLAN